jgi:hypothetical protein
VDHVASAQRTRRRVVSGNGETGKQAAMLIRGASRRCMAGTAVRSRWSKPQRCGRGELVREWIGKQRRFEKVRATIFFIFISIWMIVLYVGPFGHQDPPTRVRTKRTPYHNIMVMRYVQIHGREKKVNVDAALSKVSMT